MEASALRHAARVPALAGLSPHLRLQSDERLVALVRRGHHGAFEALVKRYHARLLAFCRHMLPSNEDAEDVLQEVFASAYNAICADERPITARPWLYRIARNRCLNHLRRPQDAGQESMDVFERDEGTTTADTVHRREEFRHVVADVQDLPETQRTALLLREIDALSYEQIADAMETTVPSVKSLLVRARVSLAEASEARQLTCAEVRLELGQAAEGIGRPSAAARRHARSCPRCKTFRRELRRTSGALAAVLPIGAAADPLVLGGGSAGAAAPGAAGGSAAAGAALVGGGGAAGVLSAGAGSVVTKAAAGLVAAALVTAGAAGVKRGDAKREPAGGPSVSETSTEQGRRAKTHDGRAHRVVRLERRRPAAASAAARPQPRQAAPRTATASAPAPAGAGVARPARDRPATQPDDPRRLEAQDARPGSAPPSETSSDPAAPVAGTQPLIHPGAPQPVSPAPPPSGEEGSSASSPHASETSSGENTASRSEPGQESVR